MKKIYYVVHKGLKPGIYSSWNECKKYVDKFEGAIFKKFTEEEDAHKFLVNGFGDGKKPFILTRRNNEDKKNEKKISEHQEDSIPKIFIYTDGSCIKQKNKIDIAGYGIYIPEKNISVSKPLLNQKITNNRAEMTAIIESLKYLDEEDLSKKICILTDSQYSMYIFNGTGERYEKNGYKNEGKDVPNIDLIKKLLELKRSHNIVLLKVRAHTGHKDEHSQYNEIADKLATSGALLSCEKKSETTNFFDKNISINELFEFDEAQNQNIESLNKGKKMKNTKLSTWFIKTKIDN
jgi:ribonuclease HI